MDTDTDIDTDLITDTGTDTYTDTDIVHVRVRGVSLSLSMSVSVSLFSSVFMFADAIFRFKIRRSSIQLIFKKGNLLVDPLIKGSMDSRRGAQLCLYCGSVSESFSHSVVRLQYEN
jgi:hypothetical protein